MEYRLPDDFHNPRHLTTRYAPEDPAEVNPDRKRATSRSFLDDSGKDLRWAIEVRKRDRDGVLGVIVLRAESDTTTGVLSFAGLSIFTEAEIWQ